MNKLLNMLGLCQRARKLISGETLIEGIKNRKVHLVIICNDASENTKKKIIDKCNYYNINYSINLTNDELNQAIGSNNRMAIGIIDVGFSKKIEELLKG